jgi:hypothetical protein
MTDPFRLNRIVRTIVEDRVRTTESRFGSGIVDQVEAGVASVRKGDPEARPTPGYGVPPELTVLPGDNVWYFDNERYKLIVKVLNRNAMAPDVGAWNPVPAFATPGTATWTPTAAVGRWARLGKRVQIEATWEGSLTKGTAAGVLQLTGLPSTVLDLTSYYPIGVAELTGWTHGGVNSYGVVGMEGTTVAQFFWSGSGTAQGMFDAADFAAGPATVNVYASLAYEAN